MGLEQCYTPQMIVNGTEEFIGSRRETGDNKISSALEQPARVAVKVAAHSDRLDATHQVAVEYEVASAPEGSVVNIALVENNAASRKGRGYVNVVRAFRTVSLNEGKHSTSIKAPSAAVASNCSIIAYVQNPRTRAVLGAAKAELREEPTGQALLQVRD
jgi:hypothetical protein